MVSLEKLADLTVLDMQSKAVRFGDLWKDRTGVIVFIRHFG